MSITELADIVHENAKAKGFHPPTESLDTFIANQCNNIHAEVTELWDAFRAGTEKCFCDKAVKMGEFNIAPLTQQEEELADIVIRALDVSKRLGIDIEDCCLRKHLYNVTRPYKHGKKN